jgi:hypothetical protein
MLTRGMRAARTVSIPSRCRFPVPVTHSEPGV